MSSTSERQLLCSLMFDELSIRKQVQWNGKENIGFVSQGTGLDDDSLPLATEVLMFIVTPLNSVWKIPIAYFLTNGLSANDKANLVREAIVRLYDVNIRISAIVCDGPSTNFAVGMKLGADLSVETMKPYFVHPCNDLWNVYVVFDAAHMLKLMRNTLADKGVLTDRNGKQIRWQHIKDLHELQTCEGLKAANKLRRNHIEWYQQKMKVNLAAQTLSRSVARALEFV
jgi:DNA transposase THAP9